MSFEDRVLRKGIAELFFFFAGDQQDAELLFVLPLQGVEPRHQADAGSAGGGPEFQDEEFAFKVVQVDAAGLIVEYMGGRQLWQSLPYLQGFGLLLSVHYGADDRRGDDQQQDANEDQELFEAFCFGILR